MYFIPYAEALAAVFYLLDIKLLNLMLAKGMRRAFYTCLLLHPSAHCSFYTFVTAPCRPQRSDGRHRLLEKK